MSRTRSLNARARAAYFSSFANKCAYETSIAPQPPAFVTIGTSFSNASMFCRASVRAPSRSPACACNAPQQTCASGDCVAQPFISKTRRVASLTLSKRPSVTQPLKRRTGAPFGALASCRRCAGLLAVLYHSLTRAIPWPRDPSSSASANSKRGEIPRAIPMRSINFGKRKSRITRAKANAARSLFGCNQTCRSTNFSSR